MAYSIEYPKAKSYDDDLKRIKKNIDEWRGYFEENNRRYHEFKKFLFKTTLTNDEINNLLDLQKPVLEFNGLEVYVSRLEGEFVKQEPSIEVSSGHDSPIPIDVRQVNIVDGSLRHIMDEAKRTGQNSGVYRDLLAGGFSAYEMFSENEHRRSLNQVWKVKRVFDPTLCGWDPLAEECHKGDGRYCYKIFPLLKEEVESKYSRADLTGINYARSLDQYTWSYYNQKNQKILLLAEYYEKKIKPITLHRIRVDGKDIFITDKQYDQMLELIDKKKSFILPPKIIETGEGEDVTICRYTLIDNQVLKYEETDFPELPIVFVDGKSEIIKASDSAPAEQMTRPYFYNARDTQRLKNFAGQTLANELENMMQHKLMMAEESISPNYKEALEDFQHASTVVYKKYADKDPNKPLDPPQVIPRVPAPPEVTNTFTLADSLTQNILGNFDLSIGKLNDTQLSGLAIQETITQSNATAMPFLNGYLLAWNQMCKFFVNIFPKYYVTTRTIPIIDAEGKRSFVRINDERDPQSVSMDYYENALQVHVEAGLNFAMQKSRTLNQIFVAMQASPLFAQFMNQKGLRILIDNFDEIRGIDQLKVLADQFMAELAQQQAMQMKQAQQGNPMLALKAQELQQNAALKQADLAVRREQIQMDSVIKTAQVQNDAEALANDRLKMAMEARENHIDNFVQLKKQSDENHRAALAAHLDLHEHALMQEDQSHRHAKEAVELSHTLTQPKDSAVQTI